MRIRGIWIALLGGSLLAAIAAFCAQAPQYGTSDQHSMDIDPHHGVFGHARPPGDSSWDNDQFFYSMYQEPMFKGRSPGFRQGFRAGYEDGRRDIEDGEQSHFGYRFRYPDRYRLEFGSRDDYIHDYQEGYKNGYRRGYAQQV